MQLISLASHFPEYVYTQKECIQAMRKAPFWGKLTKRSHRILDKVFSGNTGISKRHFALENIESVWDMEAQELSEYYEKSAPEIAAQAASKALVNADLDAADIDVLLICSCTGYLCPGLSSYVAEKIGCKPEIVTQDLTGHGCGAAVPMIQVANGYVAARPECKVLTIAVEVCSAAFFISDEIDVLISTSLFGDGAAAAIWSGAGGSHRVGNFQSLLLPNEREKVRFVNEKGRLKNQLSKEVPTLTASATKLLFGRSNAKSKVITHGGGRDVIQALEEGLSGIKLTETREVLAQYGNLSSPSVLIALERYLTTDGSAKNIWLCTFGAGFSAHSMELNTVEP